MVPDYYTRKQTLTNAERYITPRLKELEDMILGAEDKLYALEYQLFCEVRRYTGQRDDPNRETARAIACTDVFASMSVVSMHNHYVRPRINTKGIIDIKRRASSGRGKNDHKRHSLFQNDTYLDNSASRISVITGPNMAGKIDVYETDGADRPDGADRLFCPGGQSEDRNCGPHLYESRCL